MSVPVLQCLSALSVVLDLANGLAEDKSALTAAFAYRLAGEAGLGPDERGACWLAALLRHLGCTAFASAEAQLASDDLALRRELLLGDTTGGEVARALWAANGSASERAGALLSLARLGPSVRQDWTREACEAARLLSEQLSLGPEVSLALDQVFERWDGQGAPRGLAGEEISRVARVAEVAHAAVLQRRAHGPQRADEVLAARAGRSLDPTLAQRGRALLPELERLDPHALPALAAPLPLEVGAVVVAFGDFADLRLPAKRGHSRAVAALVDRASAELGLPAEERQQLVWAAHLHDLGEAALPTSLWDAPRALKAAERERIRLHPYLTERVLAGAPGLSSVARLAASHHERLDGSGYHRGTSGPALSRPARLLAAADVFTALVAARPHRPALTPSAAGAELQRQVAAGLLDADCADAVRVAAGERRRGQAPAPSLTPRELEVLRELALGRTNKEIATSLGISARTVQNHTLHIYEKLGVSTRAGAALLAARAGLVG